MKFKSLIFTLLFLSSILSANQTILIKDSFSKINATSSIEVIEDTQESYQVEDILFLDTMHLLQYSNNGFQQFPHWTKLNVKNISKKAQTIVFENPRAGMDFIDVYIFKNNTLVQSFLLGDFRPMENRTYQSLKSNFQLTLQPLEEIVVISKLSALASLELGWELFTPTEFLSKEYFHYGLFGVFVGFIITLIIVSLFIYWHSKSIFLLIFTLFLLSAILMQMHLQGVQYLLTYKIFGGIDFQFLSICGYLFSILFNLFWYLLVLNFFNLKQKAPKWRIYFITLVVLMSVYIILFSLAYFFPIIISIQKIILKIAFINIFIIFIFLFWTVYKKFFGAIEFLLATVSSKLMFLVVIFDLFGQDEIYFLSKYGILLSGFFSALFLSLALFKKITLIQQEAQTLKEQLEKQKKYAMISKTISFISHQWRQPISKLGSMTMNFQSEIEHNPDKKIKTFKTQIERFSDTLHFINQTIQDIQTLFQVGNKKTEQIKIAQTINQAFYELETEISSYNITVKKQIDQDIQIKGDPDLLKQVFFSLFQNAVDIINKRSIKTPIITVKVSRYKDHIMITIEDNAGGIVQKTPENIFDIYVSENSQSAGLGLSIVKQILELKFNGSISVVNTPKGACFKILL